MNKFTRLMGAAVAGMVGATIAARPAHADENASSPAAPTDKPAVKAIHGHGHACKGHNACKGQGGCKTGDNGCKGKNSCKGKGGCSTMPHHKVKKVKGKAKAATEKPAVKTEAAPAAQNSCKGQNACKGQGGCKTDTHACKGQNACKGQGGCSAALMSGEKSDSAKPADTKGDNHSCKGNNSCKGANGCKS